MEILHFRCISIGGYRKCHYYQHPFGVYLVIDKFVPLAYYTSPLYQILKQSDNSNYVTLIRPLDIIQVQSSWGKLRSPIWLPISVSNKR